MRHDACATQEKHAHSHQSVSAEKLFGTSHSSGNILTSASMKKKKGRKSLIWLFCCRGISSYTLTPKAGGAAPFARTRQEAPAERILQSDGGGEGGSSTRCGMTGKHLQLFPGVSRSSFHHTSRQRPPFAGPSAAGRNQGGQGAGGGFQ